MLPLGDQILQILQMVTRGFPAVLQNSAPSQETSLIPGAEHWWGWKFWWEAWCQCRQLSPLAPHTFSAITEPARRGGSPCLEWVLCLISIGLLISHFTLKTNSGEEYNLYMSETGCMFNLTSSRSGRWDTASFPLTWLSQGLDRRKRCIRSSLLASCNSASSTWVALTRLPIFLTQDKTHPPLLAISDQTHQGFGRWELSSWISHRT